MMGALGLLRAIVPVLLRSAEAGTLDELLATVIKLLTLLRPCLADPGVLQQLQGIVPRSETATSADEARSQRIG